MTCGISPSLPPPGRSCAPWAASRRQAAWATRSPPSVSQAGFDPFHGSCLLSCCLLCCCHRCCCSRRPTPAPLPGSRLLLLGGREYATNHFDRSLHSFDTRSGAWSRVPLRSSASSAPLRASDSSLAHGVASASGEVASASGEGGLDEEDDVTTPVRTGHCATVHAGRMLIFGGLNDKNHLLDDVTSVTLIS